MFEAHFIMILIQLLNSFLLVHGKVGGNLLEDLEFGNTRSTNAMHFGMIDPILIPVGIRLTDANADASKSSAPSIHTK